MAKNLLAKREILGGDWPTIDVGTSNSWGAFAEYRYLLPPQCTESDLHA